MNLRSFPLAHLSLLMCTLGFANSARAEETPGQGAVQLSLDGQLLSYASTTVSLNGQSASGTSSSFSLLSGGGLGIGALLTDDALLGARLGLSTMHTEPAGGTSTDATSFSLAPYFEYLLGPRDTARPFLGVTGGYERSSGSSGNSDVTVSSLSIGALLGVHVFATNTFSIDPTATVAYTTGSLEAGPSADIHGIKFGITVGFSGWLGSTPSKPAEPDHPESTRSAERDGDASAASPTPPAASPASSLREERGLLITNFSLTSNGRDAQIVIAGQPRKDTTRALVRIGVIGRANETAACDRIEVQIAGKSYPLGNVRSTAGESGGFAKEIAHLGDAPIETLEKLGETREGAALMACGNRWEIAPEHLARIYDFVERFRERAKP